MPSEPQDSPRSEADVGLAVMPALIALLLAAVEEYASFKDPQPSLQQQHKCLRFQQWHPGRSGTTRLCHTCAI